MQSSTIHLRLAWIEAYDLLALVEREIDTHLDKPLSSGRVKDTLLSIYKQLKPEVESVIYE